MSSTDCWTVLDWKSGVKEELLGVIAASGCCTTPPAMWFSFSLELTLSCTGGAAGGGGNRGAAAASEATGKAGDLAA